MSSTIENWCQQDGHADFELFEDFNDWINEGEVDIESPLLDRLLSIGLSTPSKAFFAGDKEAYEQALRAYRLARRHEALGKEYLSDAFGIEDGQHWYERNEQRFNQLIDRLCDEMVIPFVGAGISVGGGFPTWADHLRQQGRTAGIPPEQVEAWLEQGEYEQVIAHIEATCGRDVFTQEIRDVFGKRGSIQDITLLISDMFKDTLITTNYDQLLEQVYDTGAERVTEVINGATAMTIPDAHKTTIIKMHGSFSDPAHCILSKAQYDQAYGEQGLDMDRPIPKMLRYHFRNNSLLFIGCSLRNDRTLHVFSEEKLAAGDYSFPQHFSIEQTPETIDALRVRNAELSRLGITAIWFPSGQYGYVEDILRLARNELNYRKAKITSLD